MGLQASHNLPWDYKVQHSQMFLHLYLCLKDSGFSLSFTPCTKCLALPLNSNLKGIINHINNGVNEKSPYGYSRIGNLIKSLQQKDKQNSSLQKHGLNLAQTIVVCSMTLSHYKRFVMAIGSSEYQNVERLVWIFLSQKKRI